MIISGIAVNRSILFSIQKQMYNRMALGFTGYSKNPSDVRQIPDAGLATG
jgi:hypothetical protein